MRSRLALSLALAALVAAAPAAPAAPHAGRVDRPASEQERLRDAARVASRALRASDPATAARAWHDVERANLGLPARAPRDEHDGQSYIETSVSAAGNLDGTPGDEVLVTHVVYEGTTARTELVVRRGYDGKVLWEKSAPGYGWASGAVLGNPAKASVVFVVDDLREPENPAAWVTYGPRSITAYTATGTQLWQAHSGSADAYEIETGSYASVSPTLVRAFTDALPGAATDLVLVTTQFGTPADRAYAAATELAVIDGATGTVRPVGGPAAAVDDYVSPTVVPDISGDGLADVVYAHGTPAGGVITAYRLADGAVHWVKRDYDVTSWSSVVALGDQNGDRMSELLVSGLGFDDEFVVLSGADGTKRFGGDGEYAVPAGDIDRDRKPDVIVMRVVYTRESLGIEMAAYDASGRERYRIRRSTNDSQRGRVGYTTAGDVQGDGVTDVIINIVNYRPGTGQNYTSTQELVDGRTGRAVHRKPVGQALRAAVDGQGADFVSTEWGGGRATTTTRQGNTGAELWRTVVPGLADVDAIAHVDRDRCADLLLTGHGETSVVVALRGSDGRMLWGDRYDGQDTTKLTGARTGADRNRGC